MTDFRFTDDQWRAYQRIPDQGYSHRAHLEWVFNAWLRAHDAEVAANALRDAARATIAGLDPERCRTIFDPWDVSEALHRRADRIEREATNPTNDCCTGEAGGTCTDDNRELGSSEGGDRG